MRNSKDHILKSRANVSTPFKSRCMKRRRTFTQTCIYFCRYCAAILYRSR